ncbi:MAG: translation initiation factor IF-2 [Clostridia bacterium]|nr:translation initiation factor IF-2 [Clostridia bacterium]
MQALLNKLEAAKGTIGTLLDAARRTEGSMIDREEREKQEREERERAERLKAMLESDTDVVAHAGGTDEPEPKAEEPAPAAVEPQPEPVAPEKTAEVRKAPEQKPQRPQQPREQREPREQRPRSEGQRPQQGDRRPGENDRRQNDSRGPRRDANAGSQRAVMINPPGPADTGKQRTDKKKTFDTTDKKAKNKKTMMKEQGPTARGWEDDGQMGNRRKVKRHEAEAQQPKPAPVVIDHAVITTETITVKDLSEKLGKPANEILKKLLMLGIIANINQELDFDTCELIAGEFNITLEQQLAKSFEDVLLDAADDVDAPETLKPRPPVVTIMGHVDHGKTSLLDAIRNSHVTAGEAGGITQHIGAYTVTLNGKQITFIDTPGHEAFTAMRARGAQVTDVVILVVAADDGIMPQTIEAINHAKAAGVPIVVAINKIDRDTADPERVKQQLTEYGLVTEEWGGDTICVPVSAKKQINLDQLLEMVLLQADVLELKANPDRLAKGTIIEAQLDKARGPVATVLVQNGTLKKGDMIVAGTAFGKVRAMMDDKGRLVNSAGPSMPVEVLGFNEVPAAGDMLFAANDDKLSRQVADERRQKAKAAQVKQAQKVSLDDLFSQMAEGDLKELNLIVKADVQGSVEAVKQSLEKLSNEEVRVKVIHSGVGAITGSDIMFASASNAIVIGFNVRPDSTARTAAEKEKVDVRTYRVIYNAIEDVQNAMKGMFKPVYQEVELGRCTVRSTFRISGVGTIAGAYVNEGKVTRTAQVRVVRGGIVLHDGKIGSLKRFKDDAKEVMAGYECGISIENFNDILEDDVIECYEMEEVKR